MCDCKGGIRFSVLYNLSPFIRQKMKVVSCASLEGIDGGNSWRRRMGV